MMATGHIGSLGTGACREHGADLAFTYQGEALKKRVEPLAEEVDGLVVGHCDVTEPATMDAVFSAVQSAWGSLDFVLHAIAFSDKDQLDGRYVDTTEDNFIKTMVVSCYSFTAIAQRAEKLMTSIFGAFAHSDLLRRRKVGCLITMMERWPRPRSNPGCFILGLISASRTSARQCHLLGSDQDAGRVRDRRLPPSPKWNEYKHACCGATDAVDDVGKSRCLFSPICRGRHWGTFMSMPVTTSSVSNILMRRTLKSSQRMIPKSVMARKDHAPSE